jgi:hypothetical protein
MADHALCVGVNAYENVQQLNGCVNDINNLAHALVGFYGFADENIHLLADVRATKASILDRLSLLVSQAKSGDRLVFHFSGHGTQFATRSDNGQIGSFHDAIVPVDYNWDDDGSGLILDTELRKVIDGVADGVHFVFISDSCHSGDLTRALSRVRTRGLTLPPDLAWRVKAARVKGMQPDGFAHDKCVLISGCASDQTSGDYPFPDGDAGVLTHFLVQALSDEVERRAALTALVGSIVAEIAQAGPGFAQTPQLRGPEPLKNTPFLGGSAAAQVRTPPATPSRPPTRKRAPKGAAAPANVASLTSFADATTIAGVPYRTAAFEADGSLALPPPFDDLANEANEIIVISHGWKTQGQDAYQLYEALLANVFATESGGLAARRKLGVMGVVWPSAWFVPSIDQQLATRDLTEAPRDLTLTEFSDAVSRQAGIFGALAPRLVALAHALAADPSDETTANAFIKLASSAPGLSQSANDPELKAVHDVLGRTPAAVMVRSLQHPQTLFLSRSAPRGLNVGDIWQGLASGARAGVVRLLEQLSFYEMKARAGVIGAGLAKLLSEAQHSSTPIHLIGHSFGARVVTSAAHNYDSGGSALGSLTMLQGAFSQNALSASFGNGQVGAFAQAYKKIAGATVITHTHNDSAVSIAYPLACRLANDSSRGLGDAGDDFGAMGANGAQKLPDGTVVTAAMDASAVSYPLTQGHVTNVLADACITGHMDVTNLNVARLVRSAMG